MRSAANIAGHPIHPMLIPFPIALWVFSLIADLIHLWGGGGVWEQVAFYTLAGGILGAALAAVFGAIDYFSIKDRVASGIAARHGLLNVLALLFFASSCYLRTASGAQLVDGSLTIPVALSAVGVVLIAISGWLGGELVFRHGVGVVTKPEA